MMLLFYQAHHTKVQQTNMWLEMRIMVTNVAVFTSHNATNHEGQDAWNVQKQYFRCDTLPNTVWFQYHIQTMNRKLVNQYWCDVKYNFT